MTSSYTVIPVRSGFGQEADLQANFDAVKTALDAALVRGTASDNALSADLDMAGKTLLNLPKPANPLDPVRLTDLNSLAVEEVVQTLVFSASVQVDVSAVTYAILELTGNPTISFTGATAEGQVLLLRLKQDATGGRTVTWDAGVRFSDDLPEPTLSTAASKTDYLVFRYNLADDKYDLMAVNRGFA